jgi:thiol-disulfide isomerase/thioredoxin
MRNRFILLAAVALCLARSIPAVAQDPAQNAPQPAPKPAAQAPGSTQAPQQQAADPVEQPVSLAELARRARAKKQADANQPAAKSAKILDDDNMPRGSYPSDHHSAVTPATARQGSSASAGASPIAQYRGKVVLLDFWASWCGPCRRALPSLKRLQAVYGSEDLVVISVSEDDDEATWRTFVANNRMTWPQRFDADGSIQNQYGVDALPTYVLIGRDGSVLQTIVGEDVAESIVERIGPDLKSALSAKL